MTHPLIAIRERHRNSETAPDLEEEYKREILDLFRDYRHPWDILTELIQNAVDAINKNDSIEEGIIGLTISPTDRSIEINDNGVGVAAENIETILVPNVSIGKTSATTYGYKGVGLSFVSHLTRSFQIESIQAEKRAVYILENSIDWIAGRDNASPINSLEVNDASGESTQTHVKLILDGRYSDSDLRTLYNLDSFFDWGGEIRVLEYVLRTRTAIGNTKNYFGNPPIKPIKITATIGSESAEIPYELLTPIDSEYARTRRYKLSSRFDGHPEYQRIFLDPNKRDSDKTFNCLRHDVLDLEVGAQVRTRTKFDLSILVCGETGVTQLENDFNISNLPSEVSQSFDSGTGVFLSINGMPTSVQLHKWTDGFNKRFACFVDVDMQTNSELDKGRKGISERTRTLIVEKIEEELSRKIIGLRYSIRHAARRMVDRATRGYGGSDFASHLEKWNAQSDHGFDVSLVKPPLDENGVISIFFELIGKGLFSGYELRYISQDATWDFAFHYKVDSDRIGSAPYGLTQAMINSLGYSLQDTNWYLRNDQGFSWQTGEFKISAEDIVAREIQPLNELDLLVCWDFDDSKVVQKGGAMIDIPTDQRRFEGATHLLRDASGGESQVICLTHFLERYT